jgi:hypothetical protein
MVDLVGDQTVKQATNLLKKGERKSHQFWNSRIAVLVVLMLVLYHPDLSVCVS